jgi:hypothetical protein
LRLLKELLVMLAIAAVAVGAAVVVWQREPWVSEGERELRWVRAYTAWRDGVDSSLTTPTGGFRACAATLPNPPSARTDKAAAIAERACRALARTPTYQSPPPDVLEKWVASHDEVVSALLAGLLERSPPEAAPRLVHAVEPIAGAGVNVLCWDGDEWTQLAGEWEYLFEREEFWVAGYADPERSRIHLDPTVCAPLRRFFGASYAPFGNTASFELAEALVTLAHEAEHLRRPEASEADVECAALQRVRGLVTAAGRSPAYAEEMAGLAWDAGYPLQYEDYRTTECVDGGSLDLRPETDVWP